MRGNSYVGFLYIMVDTGFPLSLGTLNLRTFTGAQTYALETGIAKQIQIVGDNLSDSLRLRLVDPASACAVTVASDVDANMSDNIAPNLNTDGTVASFILAFGTSGSYKVCASITTDDFSSEIGTLTVSCVKCHLFCITPV